MSSAVAVPIPSPPRGGQPTTLFRSHGKDSTGDWSKAAHQTLKLANAELVASKHLRGESQKTNSELTKAVVAQQNVVNDCLKRRIKECTILRTKLKTEEKLLLSEVAQLESAKEKTLLLKKRLDRPLKKANTRATLRNNRPAEEKIADIASKAIAGHAEGVQQLQALLDGNVSKADSLLSRMRKHASTMQRDIAQKNQAISVDTECLEFNNSPNANGEARDTVTDPQHPLASLSGSLGSNQSPSLLPAAAEGPYSILKSATNVEMWKQISGFNLETARTLSNEAKDLRIKLLADVKKSTDSQAKLNADSLEALSKRKTQTKQYVTLMESQLRKLDSEIQILRGEQAKVQDALMNKQRPLDLVKKRLENRVNRPGREAVRDEVEVELEKEFQKLVVAVEALQSKNNNIENELARLEKAKAAVQADHDRKVTALQLEEQCLDLDARTEYALESRQGTPRGSSRENHEPEGFLPPISPRNGTPRGGRN